MNPDKIQHLIDHYTGQIAHGVAHYGPAAWSLVVGVKQAGSIALLAQGAVMLICGLALMFASLRAFKFGWRKADEETERKGLHDDSASGYAGLVFISGIGCLGGAVLSAIAFFQLSDAWTWIGATHPQLAVAHDIIVKVLGQ